MSNNHLIIGLGGTGGKIIRSLRKIVYQEFRTSDPSSVNLEYLYVDSSAEMMDQNDPTWRVMGRSVQLGRNSQLLITGADLSERLANLNAHPGISSWIGSQEEWSNILNTIVGEALGGQKRRLGRFLFACKANDFVELLTERVRDLTKKDGNETAVTFHICCGLAGGTGSGSIIDVITQIRHTFSNSNTHRIIVYALLPDKYPKSNWDTGNYHANGYAALQELNALSVGTLHPHDITGNKRTRLEMQNPFNGCYLLSNINERGVTVDVESGIPDIVANFLYQKTVAVTDIRWETLRKAENAENGDGLPETAPNTKIGERSKRFLTFGIKRLAIPEEEIREYLTYQFARQATLQLQYNNWSDLSSFDSGPKNQSFKEFVSQHDTQQKWLISDDHLRLSNGILRDEINNPRWKPINNSWQEVIPNFMSLVRENDDKHSWLDELAKLSEKRYAQDYREVGVEKFYLTKQGDRKDHLREIRSVIEKDLIENWRDGVQSMRDIQGLLQALIASLNERLLGVDDKIATAIKNEQSASERVAANRREWAKIGVLSDMMGKRQRLFEAQGNCLQEQYIYRTNIAAWRFAKGLLQALISELTTLQNEVGSCVSMIAASTRLFDTAIAERCNDIGLADMNQQLVKFYNPEAVKDFTKILVRDKERQHNQTKAVRDKLLAQLGEHPNFSEFNRKMSGENFTNVLEVECADSAQKAHEILVADSKNNNRLLGDSIIERLYQQFGGNIEAVEAYVDKLVKIAGNYVTFRSKEVDLKDDSIPKVPTCISSFTVIMPRSNTRPEFSVALHNAFSKSSPKVEVDFIPSNEVPCEVKPNEITLISVTNLFPLRFLEETQFLKDKYEARINGSNPTRAKLELHIEGDGTQYPSLFVPTMEQTQVAYLPFVLLGKGLNLIQNTESKKTGKKGLSLKTQDNDGLPLEIFLGKTLIDTMDSIDIASARAVRTSVEETLATDLLAHIDERSKLQKAIIGLVEEVKAECNNDAEDERYIRFLEAGRASIGMIKKEN